MKQNPIFEHYPVKLSKCVSVYVLNFRCCNHRLATERARYILYASIRREPEVLAAPPTVSAHTHLIGPHAYNFSTNQSDAYTFSTGQSQVYKNSTSQSQACRFSTVGFCWWPVVVTAPTNTACTQATRRVWAGNPAFKASKTKQEKKSLSRLRD